MRNLTKTILIAGLIAPFIFSGQALAQNDFNGSTKLAEETKPDTFEIVAVSFEIDQKLAARQLVLSTNLTNLINAKMSARIEKIQNEPTPKEKPFLVLAQK